MTDGAMSPQRYDQVRQLFLQVCELDPLEQSAILDEACADDPDLRREVQSLLAEDDTGSGALERDAAGRGIVRQMMEQDHDAAGTGLPRALGRYKLLRVIGKGGMGVVYEAEQDQPRRTVAVKLLRAGIMTPASARRFEFEAQVLGLLQHPGIAQIHDAGAAETEYGQQPYFAMELVKGQQLLNYAKQQALSPRDRLALMARICDAVQHAHTKGVVHRDLKPSNIVVDETGQPKILDFGVARATECDIKTTTLHTELGQLVGTVAYMSPEQASGDPNAVDTRSDVYALGVICHELLTDQLPYPLQGVPLHEAVRIIREQEPARLGRLDRALRGDVETIVAKALEKDKDRRYQSAAELAADFRRHLDDEPIVAFPPSAMYQLRKFARRNRPSVVAAGFALAALAAGVLGISVALFRAEHHRAAAELRAQEAIDARQLATDRLHDVEQAREKADREGRKARIAVEFFQDMIAAAGPDVAQGREITVREILDAAADRIEVDDPEVEAAIREAVGSAYLGLAIYDAGERQFRRAYDLRLELYGQLHQETLRTQALIGDALVERGEYASARQSLEECLTLQRRQLGEEHIDTVVTMNALGLCLLRQGKPDEAAQILQDSLKVAERDYGLGHDATVTAMNNLAMARRDQARYDEAGDLYTKALEINRAIRGPKHPFTIGSITSLAELLQTLGRNDEAIDLLREAIDLSQQVHGASNPHTLGIVSLYGNQLRNMGRLKEAAKTLTEVVEGLHTSLGDDHLVTITAVASLGAVQIDLGQYADAEKNVLNVIDSATRTLGPQHSLTLLARGLHSRILYARGDVDAALRNWNEVLQDQISVFGENHPETLTTLTNYGMALREVGRLDESEACLVKAVDARRTALGAEHPKTLSTMNSLAGTYARQGKLAEAHRILEEVVAVDRRTLGDDHPSTLTAIHNLASILRKEGSLTPAADAYRGVWQSRINILGEAHPNTLFALYNLAGTLEELGQLDEAESLMRRCMELSQETFKPSHEIAVWRRAHHARIMLRLERYSEAASELSGVMDTLGAGSTLKPDQAIMVQADFASALIGVGDLSKVEPLLLDCHSRLQQTPGNQKTRKEVLESLITLYVRLENRVREEECRALLRDLEASPAAATDQE